MLKASTVDVPAPEWVWREDPNNGNDWLFGAGFLTSYPAIPTRDAATGQWEVPSMENGAPGGSA